MVGLCNCLKMKIKGVINYYTFVMLLRIDRKSYYKEPLTLHYYTKKIEEFNSRSPSKSVN